MYKEVGERTMDLYIVTSEVIIFKDFLNFETDSSRPEESWKSTVSGCSFCLHSMLL